MKLRLTVPFALTAAASALALLAAAPARAGDPPPAVRALDAGDEAARAAALAALRAAEDRDALVAGTLRDAEAFAALGPRARRALVELAGELGLPFVNAPLRALVRDADADTELRRAAVVALGAHGGVGDVAALTEALETFPGEASRALVAIGGHAAENALRRRAEAGDAPLAVTAALVHLGDDTGIAPLVAALGDPARAAEAGRLLVWATGRELPPEGAAWADFVRRRQLARALAARDVDAAQRAEEETARRLAAGGDPRLLDDLVAVLTDPAWSSEERSAAALVLGLGGARDARDALLRVCRNQEDGSVRLYAGEALARVGDLSCAVPLADMLVHDEDRDRIKARRTLMGEAGEFVPVDPGFVRALFRIGCPGGAEPLLELLDGDYRTRLHRDSMRAFLELPGASDFGFEPDASKRERQPLVAQCRAWFRENRDTLGIAPRADDPGWEAFRGHVAERIKILGGFKFLYQLRAKKALVIVAEPALPQLVAALADPDLHVRMGVAEVLRGATLRSAADPLAARLAHEESPVVRTKLVWALEVCGRPGPAGRAPSDAVRRAVRAALGDVNLDVRIAAARTLGVVGEREADRAALVAARGRKENAVPAFAAASAGALELLGDRSAFGDLAEELLCDDVARRADAADVLRRAGRDLHGYDADAGEAARRAAVDAMRADA